MADTDKVGAGTMTAAQRAYEAKRAARAGKSLDAWLAEKQKRQAAAQKAEVQKVGAKPEAKKPGFFGRLIDRAHKPL